MSRLTILTEEIVMSKIHVVRGQQIMIDEDLAKMYGVTTGRLNEQVKRNHERFPADFMFHLTKDEYEYLKSQNATSSWGGRRSLPFAFTEYGVLMLSSVLNSPAAIQVNIRIMRVYTKLRKSLLMHQDLLVRLEYLDQKVLNLGYDLKMHDGEIATIFELLKEIMADKKKPSKREPIGFNTAATSKLTS